MTSHNHRIYYLIKPLIPRRLQLFLRRKVVLKKLLSCKSVWPIDERATRLPEKWAGWPEGKQFALILTHDVDTSRGQSRCQSLMGLEQTMGFRSSFNFVPERYSVSAVVRQKLTQSGCEVGVHGLYHDGKYFESRNTFRHRATKINRYIQEWGAVGYRSPSMLHNLEWMHDLNIAYDASTFDTDPFEPQPDGMCTIFPFWVSRNGIARGYVELPYTLPQDFTLFILLRQNNIDVWKTKLDWIVQNKGMALINTHPDYMNFSDEKPGIEEYPAGYYSEFLNYVKTRYSGQYWHALPRDMAAFWRQQVAST